MLIITTSGAARHGKDSFCNILKQKLEQLQKRPLKINYADQLKYIATQYYGWNGEKDEQGRTLLQQLGTEKIRSKNPNYWVDNVIEFTKVIEDDFDFVLIGDCRFKNEITRWIDKGYKLKSVHITRTNFQNNLTEEQQNHKSERDLDNFKFDCYIEAENLKELEQEVDKFITKLQVEGLI